jgi:hypothetical protein
MVWIWNELIRFMQRRLGPSQWQYFGSDGNFGKWSLPNLEEVGHLKVPCPWPFLSLVQLFWPPWGWQLCCTRGSCSLDVSASPHVHKDEPTKHGLKTWAKINPSSSKSFSQVFVTVMKKYDQCTFQNRRLHAQMGFLVNSIKYLRKKLYEFSTISFRDRNKELILNSSYEAWYHSNSKTKQMHSKKIISQCLSWT